MRNQEKRVNNKILNLLNKGENTMIYSYIRRKLDEYKNNNNLSNKAISDKIKYSRTRIGDFLRDTKNEKSHSDILINKLLRLLNITVTDIIIKKEEEKLNVKFAKRINELEKEVNQQNLRIIEIKNKILELNPRIYKHLFCDKIT